MPMLLLLSGLATFMPSVHDTSAIYEAVLTELRKDQAGRSLVLNTFVLAGHCAPHCSGPNLIESHPRPWMERLLAEGVIAGTCTPPSDRAIGCEPEEGATGVSLGVVVFEDGRAETDVILIRPTAGRIIDAEGLHLILERRADGQWVVSGRRRTWVS